MAATRGLIRHSHNGSSFGSKVLSTAKTIGNVAGTATGIYNTGKTIYTIGRGLAAIAPFVM